MKVVDVVVNAGVKSKLIGAEFDDPLVGWLSGFTSMESEEWRVSSDTVDSGTVGVSENRKKFCPIGLLLLDVHG